MRPMSARRQAEVLAWAAGRGRTLPPYPVTGVPLVAEAYAAWSAWHSAGAAMDTGRRKARRAAR